MGSTEKITAWEETTENKFKQGRPLRSTMDRRSDIKPSKFNSVRNSYNKTTQESILVPVKLATFDSSVPL